MHDSSMTELIEDYYSSRIQFGYYEAGDHLPSVSYICNQFQVSPITVRLVLARLREKKLIVTSERKHSTVVYQTNNQTEQFYLASFHARKEGMDDICQYSGLLFHPVARRCFQSHDADSVKRMRLKIKKIKDYPAKQITFFYAEAMRQLNNPLILNLYWEMVRFLRIPYLKQTFDFNELNERAAKHIERMLSLAEANRAEETAEEMLVFGGDVMRKFIPQITADDKAPSIPFKWQIYRERPQLCYTLAADFLNKIDRGIYKEDEFLPSCQSLAQSYNVSAITMRRTLELLGDIHATETVNGIGTKVKSGKKQQAPDFSHPQIRKSLLLFLQAMQIAAVTCGNVAESTLSSLDQNGYMRLREQIRKHVEKQTVYLIGETCLQFIGENSPSPFVREVYRQLYQLLLWGHMLHMFFRQSDSGCVYTAYAAELQDKLREQDAVGFSKLLTDLLSLITEFARRLLIRLGFQEEQLFRLPETH